MTQFSQDIVQNPQTLVTSNPKASAYELAAGIANLPTGWQSLYFQRSRVSAPELAEQFDKRAQDFYGGLDPKTDFFPADEQAKYPDVPSNEREAIADALNDHGRRSLRLARETLRLTNLEWLGLANRDEGAVIDRGVVRGMATDQAIDDIGYVRRLPAVDFAIVGPKADNEGPLSLAMGVSDCLAIPLVDQLTGAFGFVHADRAGTGRRTAEHMISLLRSEFRSQPKDLVAFLGEGVCQACYDIDEATYNGFVADFGGPTAINKVTTQYPSALVEKATSAGRRIAIDLYAFNKYLLAEQGVGTIVMAPNCTARSNTDCPTLSSLSWRKSVPPEDQQAFYSHTRAKGKTVGWTMPDGAVVDLNTSVLGTPRNLATVTRL